MKTWYHIPATIVLMTALASMALAGDPRYEITESVEGQPIIADQITGLVWQHWYSDARNWEEALAYCEALDYGGYTDWRLPDIQQLSSLANAGLFNPASTFPGMPPFRFWSSSTFAFNAEFAWSVNFYDGQPVNYYPKTSAVLRARCVRDGR